MKLTSSFSLEEFLVSSQHPELIKDIHVPNDLKWNLFKLCRIILQNVRDYVNMPVTITSGLRTPELTAAVGGRKASQHEFGEACDFTILNADGSVNQDAMKKAYGFIKSTLYFAVGEAILYTNEAGDVVHIHVSLPDPRFYSSFYSQLEK